MQNFFGQLRQKLSKPILFGLYGAVGCFATALVLGEIVLLVTKKPPTVIPHEIVVLLDTSGSMNDSSNNTGQTKLQEVKTAANKFVARQDLSRDSLAVIGFGSNVQIATRLTSDLPTLQRAIAVLNDGGGTNMPAGLAAAIQQLQDPEVTPSILLFTDGKVDENATLRAVQPAKDRGINLVVVGTGDADVNFLSQLTGDRDLVFYASSGQFDQAFQAAEEVIYGNQLVESGEAGDYGIVYGSLRIGAWTGMLALGIVLALIAGQNHYLRRRVLTPQEGTAGAVGGLVAGIAAGAIGQIVFVPAASISALALVARVVGWTILGTLLGGGMSLVVPNLRRDRAFAAGAVGGGAGAVGFLLAAAILGDIVGRLLGAGVIGFFIGLAIAWIEQLSRQAWLVVHWTPSEQTKISLGSDPILLGSADRAHVYLRKDRGFPDIAARIFTEDGKIIMEFDPIMRETKNMKILRHELQAGSRRKLGEVVLEVKTSSAETEQLKGV